MGQLPGQQWLLFEPFDKRPFLQHARSNELQNKGLTGEQILTLADTAGSSMRQVPENSVTSGERAPDWNWQLRLSAKAGFASHSSSMAGG